MTDGYKYVLRKIIMRQSTFLSIFKELFKEPETIITRWVHDNSPFV